MDAWKSAQCVGFTISQNNITHFHDQYETYIFSVETQYIYEATIFAKTITLNHILILSDLLSDLLALQNSLPWDEITLNIQKNIKIDLKNIELMWVPSLIGITGNEMADKVADLAIKIISHPTTSDLPT